MVQQIIVFLLGLYLLLESINAAAQMHGGDRFCRVAKYLVTSIIGLNLMLSPAEADAMHIIMAIALCLFVWPKMVARLEQLFDELIGD